MIGDTHFDAHGAKHANTNFIGVLYGYGTREEMEQEGATSLWKTQKNYSLFCFRIVRINSKNSILKEERAKQWLLLFSICSKFLPACIFNILLQ